MDSHRWQQVQNLFHECVDLPKEERNTFLDTACAEDEVLRNARLTLISGLRQVIANGLALVGVSAPESM